MKFTTKLISGITALAIAAVCCGCGGNGKTTSEADKSGDSLTAKAGTLTMATNAEFPPYEYKDGETIIGIDAEVAKLIADKLGLKLEIADVDFDSIIPGVQTGKYDMGMAGMTVTDERKQKVNFSDSYAKGIQVIIVKEGSDIKSKDDLEGKKIGTQQGTTGYIYASDTPENGGYGEENVIGYASGAVAVEALKSGKVDCVIIDNEPAKAYVAANSGLKILDTEFTNEDYAICFSKKNPELQKKVNDALNELKASGEFQKVVDKYIKAD
ncbi:MAG TPA: ABC transporter substrate-binding protein [Ruminococcaceae bacterium]|nr:ABC transporter substrate-binding protein [Oscillospiraceae bacterium]